MQIFGVKQDAGRAGWEIQARGGEAGTEAEKLFLGLFWLRGGAQGHSAPRKAGREEGFAGVGQFNPGEAEEIPAEPTEGGDSQKERGLFEESR